MAPLSIGACGHRFRELSKSTIILIKTYNSMYLGCQSLHSGPAGPSNLLSKTLLHGPYFGCKIGVSQTRRSIFLGGEH